MEQLFNDGSVSILLPKGMFDELAAIMNVLNDETKYTKLVIPELKLLYTRPVARLLDFNKKLINYAMSKGIECELLPLMNEVVEIIHQKYTYIEEENKRRNHAYVELGGMLARKEREEREQDSKMKERNFI
ncbi:MAG: hypothetical protein JW737_04585 [Acidobacteria bacterium]|nr:hypothetical protein [Acidobacteriota bacterium]